MRPTTHSEAQNIELGQPLILASPRFASVSELEIHGPSGDVHIAKPTTDAQSRRFVFDRADAPGLYIWRRPGDPTPQAVTCVRLPAAEAELIYRDTPSVVPDAPNVLIARSIDDLEHRLAQITEPQPRWLFPLSLVLFLLCLEALMGSLSQLWKPLNLRALLPLPARQQERRDALTTTNG